MARAALDLVHGGQTVRVEVGGHAGEFLRDKDRFSFVQYVDYRLVPVFLVSHTVPVYSESENSETYFVDNLLKYYTSESRVGLLFKKENDDIYMVFYIEDLAVRSLVIEFSVLHQLDHQADIPNAQDENLVVSFKEPEFKKEKSSDNTKIFDLVLQTKRSFTSKKPSVQPQSTLTTTEQINAAVSKVVLSGLRLRGLSSGSSSNVNDRLNIKEIYSMTYKSTLFAVRKYNYSFNGSQGSKHLKINDIQDIVERLLAIYIDIDSEPSPFLDKH